MTPLFTDGTVLQSGEHRFQHYVYAGIAANEENTDFSAMFPGMGFPSPTFLVWVSLASAVLVCFGKHGNPSLITRFHGSASNPLHNSDLSLEMVYYWRKKQLRDKLETKTELWLPIKPRCFSFATIISRLWNMLLNCREVRWSGRGLGQVLDHFRVVWTCNI